MTIDNLANNGPVEVTPKFADISKFLRQDYLNNSGQIVIPVHLLNQFLEDSLIPEDHRRVSDFYGHIAERLDSRLFRIGSDRHGSPIIRLEGKTYPDLDVVLYSGFLDGRDSIVSIAQVSAGDLDSTDTAILQKHIRREDRELIQPDITYSSESGGYIATLSFKPEQKLREMADAILGAVARVHLTYERAYGALSPAT